jgi:hypothetical protein
MPSSIEMLVGICIPNLMEVDVDWLGRLIWARIASIIH